MMEIKGQTIILEPGEEITVKAREKEHEVPVPEHEPQPGDEPQEEPSDGQDDTEGRLSFEELLDMFNEDIFERGYSKVETTMEVYGYLHWSYYHADSLLKDRAWMFRKSTYPLIVDYRGEGTKVSAIAYNAMQSWLMASCLAELVPDAGDTTNTQTELFRHAYATGGGCSFSLYNGYAVTEDPYAMREAASIIYAIVRGDKKQSDSIGTYRAELGGHAIEASCWDDLGYKSKDLYDEEGRKIGYETESIGYAVNARLFLPDAPGPRVEGTAVCNLPWPWGQGQALDQFNMVTGNYKEDERIYDYMVENYNMMSQTSLEEWESYDVEKKNRLINVAAIPPCTHRYMYTGRNVRFDGIRHKTYDGVTWADYFCFSETSEDTGLRLEGPFPNLDGMVRYNAKYNPNARETGIFAITGIADNMRWSLMDPNYGRCRPGCNPVIEGGERVPVHGAPENELYNVDLTTMVADNDEERAKASREDGFPVDSPKSYVSGHSAQIWALALLFTQMDNDNSGRAPEWIRKAYEYSVNRSVGRFHWNSDCIYGRLFGAMTLPILNAMSGLKDSLEAIKKFVLNPEKEEEPEPAPVPEPTGDDVISINIRIENRSGMNVSLDGDMNLVLANPTRKCEYCGWHGCYNRTDHFRFSDGQVYIPDGESMTFHDISISMPANVMDADGNVIGQKIFGFGNRSPLDPELTVSVANRKSNVLLYVGNDSEVAVCEFMDPGIVFEQGGTYTVVIK